MNRSTQNNLDRNSLFTQQNQNSQDILQAQYKKIKYQKITFWLINIVASCIIMYFYNSFFHFSLVKIICFICDELKINNKMYVLSNVSSLQRKLMLWSNNILSQFLEIIYCFDFLSFFFSSMVIYQICDVVIIGMLGLVFLLDIIDIRPSIEENWVKTMFILLIWCFFIWFFNKLKQYLMNWVYVITGLNSSVTLRIVLTLYSLFEHWCLDYLEALDAVCLVFFLIIFIFFLYKYINWTLKSDIKNFNFEALTTKYYNIDPNVNIKDGLVYKVNQFYDLDFYTSLNWYVWLMKKILNWITKYSSIKFSVSNINFKFFIYCFFLCKTFIYGPSRKIMMFIQNKTKNVVDHWFENKNRFLLLFSSVRIICLILHIIGMIFLVSFVFISHSFLMSEYDIDLIWLLTTEQFLVNNNILWRSFYVVIFWFDLVSLLSITQQNLRLIYKTQI